MLQHVPGLFGTYPHKRVTLNPRGYGQSRKQVQQRADPGSGEHSPGASGSKARIPSDGPLFPLNSKAIRFD